MLPLFFFLQIPLLRICLLITQLKHSSLESQRIAVITLNTIYAGDRGRFEHAEKHISYSREVAQA